MWLTGVDSNWPKIVLSLSDETGYKGRLTAGDAFEFAQLQDGLFFPRDVYNCILCSAIPCRNGSVVVQTSHDLKVPGSLIQTKTMLYLQLENSIVHQIFLHSLASFATVAFDNSCRKLPIEHFLA